MCLCQTCPHWVCVSALPVRHCAWMLCIPSPPSSVLHCACSKIVFLFPICHPLTTQALVWCVVLIYGVTAVSSAEKIFHITVFVPLSPSSCLSSSDELLESRGPLQVDLIKPKGASLGISLSGALHLGQPMYISKVKEAGIAERWVLSEQPYLVFNLWSVWLVVQH